MPAHPSRRPSLALAAPLAAVLERLQACGISVSLLHLTEGHLNMWGSIQAVAVMQHDAQLESDQIKTINGATA